LTTTQLQDGSIVAGYGSCSSTSKATISGADDFSAGWTKSGNIWSRRIPTGTPKITQLFVNGVRQRTAQYPNFGGIGHEYAIASSSSPASSTVLKAGAAEISALSNKDVVGASIIVKVQPFFVDQRTVAAYDRASGQFSMNTATSAGMEAGDGYLLQDKLWMLDAPGEFFHDQANGVLYVYPSDSGAQSTLNNYRVEGTVRALALQVNNRSRLTIQNIAAVKTKTYGLQLSDAPAATVDSVTVSDNASTGLRVIYNASGTIIRNSVFAANGYMAIDATSASGVTISNNVVTDTGMGAYAGGTNRSISNGPSGVTTGNTLRRNAYIGIGYSGTGGSQVTNNLIEDTCMRFADGGAIYTWNGSGTTVNQSSLIQGNIVARGVPNNEGAVGGGAGTCNGIYADDMSRSVTIRGNTVIDMPIGIILHNASYNLVESNKVWLSKRTAMWITMDRTNTDAAVSNVIRNNQFNTAIAFSGSYPQIPYFNPDYTPIWFWHAISGIDAIRSGSNSFSGNELLMLNGDSATAVAVRGGAVSGITNLSSSEWRKVSPAEAAPRLTSQFAPYTANYGPELVANGDFLSGLSGWTSWFASASNQGSVSISSATGCASSCAVFSAGTAYDVLSTPSFGTSNGALYRLKFNGSFLTDGAMSIPGTAGGTGLSSFVNRSSTAGQTVNYEGFFAATGTSGRINLGATAGTRIGYDGLSVKQITGYTLAKPSDWAAYAYATPTAGKTVDCSTLGWASGCSVTDGNGAAVSLPTTLAAGQAKLFLLKNTALRIK